MGRLGVPREQNSRYKWHKMAENGGNEWLVSVTRTGTAISLLNDWVTLAVTDSSPSDNDTEPGNDKFTSLMTIVFVVICILLYSVSNTFLESGSIFKPILFYYPVQRVANIDHYTLKFSVILIWQISTQ